MESESGILCDFIVTPRLICFCNVRIHRKQFRRVMLQRWYFVSGRCVCMCVRARARAIGFDRDRGPAFVHLWFSPPRKPYELHKISLC